MAVSILGVAFASSSGGTVTVPSGTQGILAFASHYSGTNSTLASLSLQDATGFTSQSEFAATSGVQGIAVASATTSSTGSKTLSFAFSATPTTDGGPVVGLVFVSGINTSDWIRAAGTDSDASTTRSTVTISSNTTDAVLGFSQRYQATPDAVAGSTSQGTSSFNGQFCRIVSVDSPGASSTTYLTPTGANYDSLSLVSIKEGAANTAALTGSAATSAAGTLGRTVAQSVTGIAATAASGTVRAAPSYALTGIAASAGVGTIKSVVSNALSGAASTTAAGTLGISLVNPLTGQSSTAAAGTFGANVTVALTGVAATTAAGAVSYDSAIVLALSGQAATAAAGTPSALASYELAGAAASSGVSTVQPAVAASISGADVTSAAGGVGSSVTVALTGASATASAGSVNAGNDIVVALSGQACAADSGSVGVNVTVALSGVTATAAPGALAAPGGSSAADVWSYVMANGKTAAETVVETHAMLRDLYRIHGLEIGMPLAVGTASRTAGPIEQSVGDSAGVVTVTRLQ